MSALMGMHQIAINTASLVDGSTIAAYLTSASGALISSTTIGGKEYSDSKGPEAFLSGTAYAPGTDYLAAAGVVNNAGNWVPFTLNAAGELPVSATVNFAGDYAEDSPHVSGDVGLFSLAVRRDARTSGTSADGDYASFNVNANGEIYTKDTDTFALLTALSKAEDAAHASGDQGIQSLLVRQDVLASSTSADGDYGSFKSNAAGELYVADSAARTTLTAILADTATIDSQTLTIQNTLTALSKAEDAAHASGDQGIQALAVRRDSQGTNTSADGDYSSFQTWSEGSLKVVDVANGAILQQQVGVTTTAAQIPAANLANRKSLMVQNTGSSKVWVGSATLTSTGAASGIELPANSFMELECGPAVNVFAKTNAGTGQLNLLELA